MIKNGNQIRPPTENRTPRITLSLKWLSSLLLFLFVTSSVLALEEPEDRFLTIYKTIEKADLLNKSGDPAGAKIKYQEAQGALMNLKRTNPTWNSRVVNYRLNYVTEKITSISKPAPAPEATATPAEQPAETSGEKPKAKASPTSAAQIKVISNGGEPRKQLRLEPKAGDTQKVGISTKVTMDMGMGAPVTLPKTTLPMDIAIKSIAENGDVVYEMTYGDPVIADEPGGTPGLAETFKTALAGIAGTTGTTTVSAQGVHKTTNIKYPANATPQLRQALDQVKESMAAVSTPLPSEPIGIGAKWEAKQQVKSQGMTISQTSSYELVSAEASQIVIKSAIEQSAANQKLPTSAMGGLKADLVKMTGTMTGSMTWDMSRVMPNTGTLEGHNNATLSVTAGNQKQPMEVKTNVKIEFESK